MQRRDLLKTITLLTGTVLAAPIAAALLRETPNSKTVEVSATQTTLIGELAEFIIPETDTPGALAAGVDQYITLMVSQYLEEVEAVAYLAGLDAFTQRARETFNLPWAQGSAQDRLALVEQVDQQAFSDDQTPLSEFWRRHKALTVAGYYTSEVGATVELRRMPMGPFEADIPYDRVGRSWS